MADSSYDTSFDSAWDKLGRIYPSESWFRDVHLAENRDRIKRIVVDLQQLVPPGQDHPVVDIGCFNGFLCFLLKQLGYSTAGIDALPDEAVPERAEVMASVGASFYHGNFNTPEPFPRCPRGHFSGAILGEVFEHILNHPLGLLVKIGELLRPGGILILTTPNPYTLANSLRLLAGRGITWGDTEFATMPKVDCNGSIISYEGIHYREYSQRLLASLVTQAGFSVVRQAYIGVTAHPKQPFAARMVKTTPVWRWLQTTRLFGSGNYLVARKASPS